MSHKKYQIDDSKMPLMMGSAIRVPSYAYKNWGIPEGRFRGESDAEYEIEWEGGSKRQMDYVIESLKKAGMENYSQMLRDANAKLVATAVKRVQGGKVKILEPGFGESTVNLFDALDDNDKDRIYITGLEPSKKRWEEAAAKLEKMGLKRGKGFEVYSDVDNHMLDYVGPESQDIICSVATTHHHACLDTPFAVSYNALRPFGLFTVSDWHNSIWEHPSRVYEFLKSLDWETKEKYLEAFVKKFPSALEVAPEINSLDKMANEHIMMFWRDGWIPVRHEAIEKGEFDRRDDILMLEGQRPVEEYFQEMHRAGFYTDTPSIKKLYQEVGFSDNPHQLVEDSRILMTICGQRPIGIK